VCEKFFPLRKECRNTSAEHVLWKKCQKLFVKIYPSAVLFKRTEEWKICELWVQCWTKIKYNNLHSSQMKHVYIKWEHDEPD